MSSAPLLTRVPIYLDAKMHYNNPILMYMGLDICIQSNHHDSIIEYLQYRKKVVYSSAQ